MECQDYFARPSAAPTPAFEDEDLIADIDEPPDRQITPEAQSSPFYKSIVRTSTERRESLLTRALMNHPQSESDKSNVRVSADLARRRSMISNTSLASTAELTSDGGFTSPARTSTPSPPPPNTYTSFAPFAGTGKAISLLEPIIAKEEGKGAAEFAGIINVSPRTTRISEDPPKRRCISFACDGKKGTTPATLTTTTPPQPVQPIPNEVTPPPKRKCTIQFACMGPKPSHKNKTIAVEKASPIQSDQKANITTSLTPTRRSLRAATSPSARPHRDSTSTVRRVSRSPIAVRAKAKFLVADERALRSSDAKFHEFAGESLQDDDWIAQASVLSKEKMTIDYTLKKENAIRRLGSEAEEEALEEEEEEDEDDDQEGSLSDGENDFEDYDDDGGEDDTTSLGDVEGSDGNETDNEAGFADSDDDSDAEGDFAFWRPGRELAIRQAGEPSTYRPSAHRTASTSSIDSLHHMSPPKDERLGRRLRRRPIKIRPGTPELPDSTDFVCGTLDEDRPLENAYVSCMEARKYAKHKQTPQDIDPSFPISDIEVEEAEDDIIEDAPESDEHVWLHGKFEDDDDQHRRQVSALQQSPRRFRSPPPPHRKLHSPPPAKHRLRSPPPRRLFGNSPKCMRSPPLFRTISSPATSPMTNNASNAITFVPLGSRPGLTHTKSLPRTPNAFCRQYTASRMAAANGNPEGSDETDPHIRGAIDIQKGLENKRQRRKEKLLRKKQDKPERKPQPGRGAERMRELGLLMAGKTEPNNPYILSA